MDTQHKPGPRARAEGLVVQELADEVLVYDLDRHLSHCLNHSAAFVWRHCNGRTSVRELATLLQREFNLPEDEGVVRLALDHLQRAHLLRDWDSTPAANASLSSRRALMRKLGLAGGLSLLLPWVESIVTPAAASAASCKAKGTACVADADCCLKGNGQPCTCTGTPKTCQGSGCN
jgi:hypothetical protein